MNRKYDRPVKTYVDMPALEAAMRAGGYAERKYLEDALARAERDRDSHGKHEALLWLIDFYTRCNRTETALALAIGLESATHDDVKLLISLGTSIYFKLGDGPLALAYLDRAHAILSDQPMVGGALPLGSRVRSTLSIKRLQLRIIAETDRGSERAFELLEELTYLTRHTITRDDHLTRALTVLIPSGVANRDHMILLRREQSNLLSGDEFQEGLRSQLEVVSALVASLGLSAETEAEEPGADE